MKKLGHKETKAGNQLLILQTLLSGTGFSRVELAEKTKLSPSTVTSLTADLLKRGIIEERGTKVITAGRARTELTVSNSLGYLLVLEISHGCIYITTLSMRLEIQSSRQICSRFMDGNSIFSAVVKEIVDVPRAEPLAGIGILFQEDVREHGFHVMYSTGYEAANISLKDALKTQFRVPVLEDSVAAFTVTDVIREVGMEKRNVAHIQLGAQIRTVLQVDGGTVMLKDHFVEDLSAMLPEETSSEKEMPLACRLAMLLNILYAMFCLDTVLIAGKQPLPECFLDELRSCVNTRFTQGKKPDIVLIREGSRERTAIGFAARVRAKCIQVRLEGAV